MRAAPTDPLALDAIRRWLAGSGRWATVTGLPGVGRHRLVEAALGDVDRRDLRVIDGPGEPSGQRTLAIHTGRHLHPDEQVIEVRAPTGDAAMALFVDAMRRLGSNPPIADDGAVRRLIALVGGHPLALELLARRSTLMPLAELIARLERDPADGADPLMHSERPPFDGVRRGFDVLWSRLDPMSRAVSSRCAVFAGPFTLADAEQVTGAGLDALQTLRDHNLIEQRGGHLQVPAIVRRYVRARHPAPDGDHRHAHLRLFAARAARAADDAAASRPDGLSAIEAIEAELLELAAGPERGGTSDARCDIMLALAALAERRGSADDQQRFAACAVEHARDDARRVRAHVASARALRLGGQTEPCRRLLAAIEPIAVAPDLRARWTEESSSLASKLGELHAAEGYADETLRHVRALGDPYREARALNSMGVVRFWQGRVAAAVEVFVAAGEISRRLGAQRLLSIAASNQCLGRVWTEEHALARAAGEEALSAFRALGDKRGEGTTLNNLAMVALHEDRLDDAEACARAAIELHRSTGFRPHEAYARVNLAEAAFERGDLDAQGRALDAVEAFNRGLPHAAIGDPAPLDDPEVEIQIARSRAQAAVRRGELAAARRFIEHAHALARTLDMSATDAVSLGLERARIALLDGDRSAAETIWRSAEARAAEASRAGPTIRVAVMGLLLDTIADDVAADRLATALRAPSVDTRRVLRWVWPDQPRAVRREARARLAGETALVFDDAERAVRLPDGRWVDVSHRRLLWRLLTHLADADAPQSPDALIAVGWPGEAIRPSAATNRLYNAIALLRRAGLNEVIVKDDAGYAIDARLTCVRLDPRAIDGPEIG